jgi:hypothetical protein
LPAQQAGTRLTARRERGGLPVDEDRPAEDETVDAEPEDAAESTETEGAEEEAETEAPPGSDPEAPVSEQDEPDAAVGASGSPDQVPEHADERTGAAGVPRTTTTGDPEKDLRGPSVTEESRRQMEGDPALDEPGYGDLGHAEDFDILRDD